ncbi:unnamed protein product [Hyaloperonospora brassicae]|uniref:Peptidyl-prolyl cis-trans isomerase n=1 Tax=Hyaloperonospora brassicae TaxID=162125 RepID=A0AAV0UN12_HYABA|nr:unnamed protein product [Hyaloperonospora brassicae]
MGPPRGNQWDTRKTVLVTIGLLLVSYFIVVNVFFFDFSTQSPSHLASQMNAPAILSGEVDKTAHNGVDTTAIRATKLIMEPRADRKYVWLDVAIDDKYVGRVTIELYAEQVPKTVENFRALVTGEKGSEYTFKGSVCHRILKNFIVQCGDYTTGTGTGGRSIYGAQFDDEFNGLRLKHSKRYLLQMANAGPNTNGSQFCFMLNAAPHLNGKHVVFGEVVGGFDVVDQMEEAGVEKDGVPLQHKVSFMDGGEILS